MAAPSASDTRTAAQAQESEALKLLARALAPVPGGLTPEQAARRAASTSPTVAISQAELRAAATRVDQAIAAYFPTARLQASYTRLSPVDNVLETGLPQSTGFSTVTFPVFLDQYAVSASFEVPVSDYLLRLTQAYATVSLDVDARKLELQARELDAALQAKVAYFTWIRAKGQAAVAVLAEQLSGQHLADARAALAAGYATEADVARLVAQQAESEHLVVATGAVVKVAEKQLRVVMHEPEENPLRIGIDVLGDPPAALSRDVSDLRRMALARRIELKSLDKAKESLEEQVAVISAGHYPRLDAVANLIYANPNPRVFPQKDEFDFTWDVGVRLSWTVNETFVTMSRTEEARQRVAIVDAQLQSLRDGIVNEVTSAYFDDLRARSAMKAADERERAAAIALEARRRLFASGHATATDIVDAEAELTRARLQRVDSRVDLWIARARLEHAVGGPL